ncbi:MAG: lipoyl(octanoyl) transferase [Gaiellaceae bacterium]|nr:lipoyl(octanoyl) transferase [Gaiellaceae bacterium]
MRTAEVAIFVTRDHRREVLLVHRSPSQGSYWHTIAGGIEAGETPEQAAVRELREETTLDGVDLVPLETTVEYAYPLSEEPPERGALYAPGLVAVRVHCFLVEAPDRWEPTLDWEHDDYRWCPPDEGASALRWPETAGALRRLLTSP